MRGEGLTEQRISEPSVALCLFEFDALLCNTFTLQDEYADLNTVLYSFREVIRRVKAWMEVEHAAFGDGAILFSYSPYSNSKVCVESCKQVYNCVGYRVCHYLRGERHTKSYGDWNAD